LVGTYLTKIGLPYEAVTYITQATSNEMTWLNMSDAAQRGIRVTLLSSLAKETVAAIPTRYGDVTVTRDDPECCVGHIRYGNQRVEIASTGQIYASLEGVYKVKEGDLVVISSPSEARGSPGRRPLCQRTNARWSSIWLRHVFDCRNAMRGEYSTISQWLVDATSTGSKRCQYSPPEISIVFVPLFARAGHTSQSRLAAYFADIRMFRLTLIHGSTSANFVVLVDSGSSLPLASKVRRVVEVANDAPILEM